MQKHQLAHVFRKTADLLGIGTYPPQHAAPVMEMIQFLTFVAEQIEKDTHAIVVPPREIVGDRPEAQ